MRRWRALAIAVSMIGAIVSSSGVSAAEPGQQLWQAEAEAARSVIAQLDAAGDQPIELSDLSLGDLGPPPWTSFVPNRDPVALEAWQRILERFPEVRGEAANYSLAQTVLREEAEPSNDLGLNDTPETGEPVVGFGTGSDDSNHARIGGFLYEPPPPPDCESIEDDGAIPSASPTNTSGPSEVHLCTGVLGDGPNGETTGDFDMFVFHDVAEGSYLVIDVAADRETKSQPDTTLAIYDSAGNLIAEADDKGGQFVGFIEVMAPTSGDFYGVVGGLDSTLSDPFDSASGSGATTAGPYEVFIVNFSGPPACPIEEDDGSIPLSNDVSEIVATDALAFCNGFFGDGPFGETSGDFDFYFLGELPAGATAIVDVFSPGPMEGSTVALYDSTGTLIASVADDGAGEDFLEVTTPADEFYFALVGPGLPSDPFDSSSGSGQTAFSEYSIAVGAFAEPGPGYNYGGYNDWSSRLEGEEEPPPTEGEEPPPEGPPTFDTDFYLIDMEAGDALSAGFDSAFEIPITLELYDPDGELVIGSPGFSVAFAYPFSSPLRHLGDTGIDHVAGVTGTYALAVAQSFGPYEGELRIARPGRESAAGSDTQIIHLDFDGDTIDPNIFDPFFAPQERELSALSTFLADWGLEAGDEDAVIDAVIAKVNAELRDHLRSQGTYGDRDSTGVAGEFDIEITNSRDHGDMWGEPNVSRVIVGGTIDELQIGTVGIASSIDPGNLYARDQAVVLLDLLSGNPEEVGDVSLNIYDFAEPLTKIDVVGHGIGVIVAHEVGHFVGNWHTETGNESFQIMDAGGDLPGTLGVGPDFIFGTVDDVAVHFGADMFNSFEGFFGDEDTEVRTGFAMATGPAANDGPPTGISIKDLAEHHKFGVADAQVLRLYVAFFNRQPDIAGANYWVGVRNDGSTLADIAGFFTLSEEFKNTYAGTTNPQYLEAVYTNVLGREFDQDGFDYWLNLLDTKQLDRGGVVQWISLNPEFITANLYGGL